MFSVTEKYKSSKYGDEKKEIILFLFKSKYELLKIVVKKDIEKFIEETEKLVKILEDEDAYEHLFTLYYDLFFLNESLTNETRQMFSKRIPEDKYILLPENVDYFELCS